MAQEVPGEHCAILCVGRNHYIEVDTVCWFNCIRRRGVLTGETA